MSSCCFFVAGDESETSIRTRRTQKITEFQYWVPTIHYQTTSVFYYQASNIQYRLQYLLGLLNLVLVATIVIWYIALVNLVYCNVRWVGVFYNTFSNLAHFSNTVLNVWSVILTPKFKSQLLCLYDIL
jgi:hypothetical protein